jgi:hypothetical protein
LELTNERSKICRWAIENILENIIAKLVLRQLDSVLDELLVELMALFIISVVYATLEDAAAMLVTRYFNAIVRDSIENKLQLTGSKATYLFVTRLKLVKTFLDDMITIEIFRELDNIRSQCIFNKFNLQLAALGEVYLFRKSQMLKEFLHRPGPMLIK